MPTWPRRDAYAMMLRLRLYCFHADAAAAITLMFIFTPRLYFDICDGHTYAIDFAMLIRHDFIALPR